MLYLLDTNAVSDLMNSHPRLTQRLAALSPNDRGITCTIVRGEIMFGVEQAQGKKRQLLAQLADAVFGAVPCETVPAAAADVYARIKHDCRVAGVALDENDLWIAATSMALGAVLVTRDADFSRVTGVTAEDWTI